LAKTIHIVSFDVPFPPDYGGAIDVYYKLQALHKLGVSIILHCFEYGRSTAPELEAMCEKVYYYKRNNSRQNLFSFSPFIVVSRSDSALLENLLKDDHPILFEGLHCCFFLNNEKLRKRVRVVRTHNIEHHYYKHLAAAENSIFKRFYFELEANKLASFEAELCGATALAAISPADFTHFSALNSHTFLAPAFHSNTEIVAKRGMGNFCLYHGSLGIGENNKAALWLVNEVFNDLDIPLVIAGNNSSAELRKRISEFPHITLATDISTAQIFDLLADAQINVLPTFQATGIKLKLLAALFRGRHCVVNLAMVENTGLEPLCHIASDAEAMKKLIKATFQKEFDTNETDRRKEILIRHFSNEQNARKLIQILFPES
jgi:hypothetical protein